MAPFTLALLTLLFTLSLSNADPDYFVITTVPTNSTNNNIGYLTSNGTTISDPFLAPNTLFAIVNNTLTSYSSSDGDPTYIGLIGTTPSQSNSYALLKATAPENVTECASINMFWWRGLMAGRDGFEQVFWNAEFETWVLAYFCVTDGGVVGGSVYAVFGREGPAGCVRVSLELGG